MEPWENSSVAVVAVAVHPGFGRGKYEEYRELEKKERCKILIQYSELVRTKKRQNSFVMMMSHQWAHDHHWEGFF